MHKEIHRLNDIFTVVFIGHGNRLGHDDQRCAVNGGINIGVILEDFRNRIPVGDIGFVEDMPLGKLSAASNERI